MFKRKTVKPSASIFYSDTAASYVPNLKPPFNHHISIKVAFISLLFLIPLLCMISYSAWAAAEGNVFLEVPGIDIEYGGYDTCEMYADGAPAFCAEPAKDTPKQGVYSKADITPLQSASGYSHDKQLAIATMWFGWGGPGFDASLWPNTWYDGTPMNAHRYWALTHIVLSDFYTCNGGEALAGCSDEFCNWALGNVLSYVSESSPYDPRAAQSKINERAWEVPQAFRDACYQLNTGSTQVILSFESGGWIDLDKDSANSSVTASNNNYSLEQAQYAIYKSKENAQNYSERVGVLTTDKNGYAKSSYLERGTYYIKEIVPSLGYELDDKIYSVEVKNGSTARVGNDRVYDEPAYDSANLLVQKRDVENNSKQPQGDATLEGAEFRISYFDGFFETAESALASGQATRTWIFKTDATGAVNLSNPAQLVSGELYYSSSNKALLPLGTYLIEETKAPQGYLPTSGITLRTVKQNEDFSAQGTFLPLDGNDSVKEQVIRGGISFNKLDRESLLNTPLGAGKLDAVFDVINASSHNVIVNEKTFKPGEVVYTGQAQQKESGGYFFSTDSDDDGIDRTLPFGTYQIKERIAGQGYLLSEEELMFNIEKDGAVVSLPNDKTFTNQIKRGDVELIKVRESDMARLAGIPFKITSESTGETHVLITDENGILSTASSQNKHSFNTNGNDFILNSVNNKQQKPTTDNQNKHKKSLLEDKNSVDHPEKKSTNTPATNNADVSSKNDENTNHNNSNDENSNEEKYLSLAEALNDLITQTNTGNSPSSKDKTTNDTSENESSNDTLEADPSSIKLEETGIWFGKTQEETLTQANDSLGALPYDTYTIEELPCEANKNYTLVKIEGISVKKENTAIELGRVDNKEEAKPYIHTFVKDANDRDKLILADSETNVIDHVEYGNLAPGRTYILKTTVFDNETQTLLPEITAELSFTPPSANGSVDIELSFDTLSLGNHSLTIFEELYEDDKLVCEHKDANDSEQTLLVQMPTIATYAFDSDDEDKELISSAKAHLTDRVTYENLIPGKEYQLIGFIVDPKSAPLHTLSAGDICNQETLQQITAELKTDHAPFNMATTQFTPKQQEGEITVEFELDSKNYAGKTFVVFEYLVKDERVIALHTDTNDEKQRFGIETPPAEILSTENSPATELTQTNDSALPLFIGLVCLIATVIGTISYRHNRMNLRKEEIISRISNP